MRVHSCTVDDSAGDNVLLIDEDGCAIDKYLLNNLEYPSDLMAMKEAHVFKYQDRPVLLFNCQIQIDVKVAKGSVRKLPFLGFRNPTRHAPSRRNQPARNPAAWAMEAPLHAHLTRVKPVCLLER